MQMIHKQAAKLYRLVPHEVKADIKFTEKDALLCMGIPKKQISKLALKELSRFLAHLEEEEGIMNYDRSEEAVFQRALLLMDLIPGLPRISHILTLAGCFDETDMLALYMRCCRALNKKQEERHALITAAEEKECEGDSVTRRRGKITQELFKEVEIKEFEFEVQEGETFTASDILLAYERSKMKQEAVFLENLKDLSKDSDIVTQAREVFSKYYKTWDVADFLVAIQYKQSKSNANKQSWSRKELQEFYEAHCKGKKSESFRKGKWNLPLELELERLRRQDINSNQELAIYGPKNGVLFWLPIRMMAIGPQQRNAVFKLFFEHLSKDELLEALKLLSRNDSMLGHHEDDSSVATLKELCGGDWWEEDKEDAAINEIEPGVDDTTSSFWYESNRQLEKRFLSVSNGRRMEWLDQVFGQLSNQEQNSISNLLTTRQKRF